MGGTATLGAASDQNHGIVNRSQFGPGRWQASRVANTTYAGAVEDQR